MLRFAQMTGFVGRSRVLEEVYLYFYTNSHINNCEFGMARGRGRPRKFDEAEVRRAILQTFWMKGYAVTSLDDLSKATGLVRPSLYGAFGSKRDMYVMAMDEFLESIGVVRTALSSASAVETALQTFYSHMLEVYCDSDRTKQLGCFLVGTALTDTPSNPAIHDAPDRSLRAV